MPETMPNLSSPAFLDLPGCVDEVGLAHDVVAVKYSSCLVTGDRHGYAFGNSSPNHVSDCRAPQVMEDQSVPLLVSLFGLGQLAKAGPLAERIPRSPEVQNGLPVRPGKQQIVRRFPANTLQQ